MGAVVVQGRLFNDSNLMGKSACWYGGKSQSWRRRDRFRWVGRARFLVTVGSPAMGSCN